MTDEPTTVEEWHQHAVTLCSDSVRYAVKAWQDKIAAEKLDLSSVDSSFINAFILEKRIEYFNNTPNHFASFEKLLEMFSQAVTASGEAMRKRLAELREIEKNNTQVDMRNQIKENQ